LGQDERFTIEVVAPDGQPIASKQTKDKFVHQCGVIVRDSVPISIQEWNKKKDPEVSYVDDRQKDELWNSLMTNFSLPPEEDPNNPVIQRQVKSWALKKMAELFKNWKKRLNEQFVENDKTPEFTGQYAKIKDHWPAFVA
jgi:hypothetical protein